MTKQDSEKFEIAAQMVGVNLYNGDWEKHLVFALLYEYHDNMGNLDDFMLKDAAAIKIRVAEMLDELEPDE